jgi:hypothetical protein
MDMQRCRQGHYFDAQKSKACPACGIDGLDIVATTPKRQSDGGVGPLASTQPRGQASADAAEDRPTVGVVRKQLGIDPVVGWLVCIAGAQRGKDYRLHSERNLIGRAPEMDVCITGDESISRNAHAVVVFEPRQRTFRLSPGEGRGLVYLNGEMVEGMTKLEANAVIELGQTKLMFVPCPFSWT